VALAVLQLFEFINKFCFLLYLWPTTKLGSFCATGVSIVCNSLLALYFSVVVVTPVHYAIVI